MIHYSCDRCKRSIEPDELRYVIRLEAAATMDWDHPGTAWDDDRDHLMEVEQIAENMAFESDLIGPDVYDRRPFDLCPECYRRFKRNPLGIETAAPMEFSDN